MRHAYEACALQNLANCCVYIMLLKDAAEDCRTKGERMANAGDGVAAGIGRAGNLEGCGSAVLLGDERSPLARIARF